MAPAASKVAADESDAERKAASAAIMRILGPSVFLQVSSLNVLIFCPVF